VRPHGLRHSAATEVARHGSLDELMSLGGWKSFSAAQVYLDQRVDQRRRALALVDA
jgi:integrase